MADILQNSDKELLLEKVESDREIYYIDNKRDIFNINSNPIKFEKKMQVLKKQKMDMNHLIPVKTELIKEIYSQGLKKVFEKYDGMKIGENFSLEDALKVIMGDEIEKVEEKVEVEVVEDEKVVEKVDEKAVKKVKVKVKKEKEEKEVKVKKIRKISGYNIFCKDNKSIILEKVKVLQENAPPDKNIRWLSAASILWKELSSDNKNSYEEKAKIS